MKFITRLFIKFKKYLKLSNKSIPSVSIETGKNGIFCGFKNDYLFQEAVKDGIHEPHFVEIVNNLLSPTDIALDVGGNIGTHAILLSKKLSKGKVYTFESQALVFSILQNNLLLNSCSNVISYRFAILDKDHETLSMEPFSFNGKIINNGGLKVDLNKALGDFTLTRTLDSFEFSKVDFIKMDIQGSEVKALRGAKKILLSQRPILFIEIEEQCLRALNSSTKELIETLFSLKYGLYRIENHYPCDYICIPIEKSKTFEDDILNKLSFPISKKIFGKTAIVTFDKETDQIYSDLKVF